MTNLNTKHAENEITNTSAINSSAQWQNPSQINLFGNGFNTPQQNGMKRLWKIYSDPSFKIIHYRNVKNEIICGDYSEVLQQYAEAVVNLTVVSPPYDKLRQYNGDWAFDYSTLGKELFRVTSEGGACAVVINDGIQNHSQSLTTFRLAVDWVNNGWHLNHTFIYHRDGRPGGWTNRFRQDHEYILVFHKGAKPRTVNKEPLMIPTKYAGRKYAVRDRKKNGELIQGKTRTVNPLKCRGTVWNYAPSCSEGNKLKLKHPATFPDKLAEDLILCFSNEGDIVLDPMSGSATTLVMAAKHKRNYLGVEISKAYVSIAEERLLAQRCNIFRLFRSYGGNYSSLN